MQLYGPPRVIAQTMSKVRRESITVTAKITVFTFLSCGMTMCRNRCHQLAPSTAAASSSVGSTALQPGQVEHHDVAGLPPDAATRITA